VGANKSSLRNDNEVVETGLAAWNRGEKIDRQADFSRHGVKEESPDKGL
jgi:hypothetical protein